MAILLVASLCVSVAHAGPDHTVVAGEQTFHVTLVKSPRERARGLMDTDALAPDQGLLMLFPTSRPVPIWMKNMRYPLDIVWISQTGNVVEIRSAPVCESSPCPRYFPDRPARFVLEVGQGRFQGKVGDKIAIFDASGDSLLPKRPRDSARGMDLQTGDNQ